MSFIIACIYAITTAIAILGMAYVTNKKIKSNQPIEDIEITEVSLYKKNFVQICLLIVLVVISGFCGYKMAQQATSWLAVIKIGCCYTATVSAAVIDYKLKIIPNYISVLLIMLRLAFAVYELVFGDEAVGYIIGSLTGCMVSFLILGIANKLSKGGIGLGDVKLLSCIGFMCDIYIVIKTLTLALLACICILGVLLILKKQTVKDHLPFAPFIHIGFIGMCLSTL